MEKYDVIVDVSHEYNQQVVVIISDVNERPWLLCGIYASIDYRL